jgi:hypothetical protein
VLPAIRIPGVVEYHSTIASLSLRFRSWTVARAVTVLSFGIRLEGRCLPSEHGQPHLLLTEPEVRAKSRARVCREAAYSVRPSGLHKSRSLVERASAWAL